MSNTKKILSLLLAVLILVGVVGPPVVHAGKDSELTIEELYNMIPENANKPQEEKDVDLANYNSRMTYDDFRELLFKAMGYGWNDRTGQAIDKRNSDRIISTPMIDYAVVVEYPEGTGIGDTASMSGMLQIPDLEMDPPVVAYTFYPHNGGDIARLIQQKSGIKVSHVFMPFQVYVDAGVADENGNIRSEKEKIDIWLAQPPSGEIPVGSKVTLVDFSSTGNYGAKINGWDWQAFSYGWAEVYEDYVGNVVGGYFDKVHSNKPVQSFIAGHEGYLSIFGNVKDDFAIYDRKGKVYRGYPNWGGGRGERNLSGNYIMAIDRQEDFRGEAALLSEMKIKEWHFLTYKFRVIKPKVEAIMVARIAPNDTPVAQGGGGGGAQVERIVKLPPDPSKPEEPPTYIVPPETEIELTIDLEIGTPDGDGDKTENTPGDGDQPAIPPAINTTDGEELEEGKEIIPKVDVEVTTGDGNKTTNVIEGDDPLIIPDKKEATVTTTHTYQGGTETICVSVDPESPGYDPETSGKKKCVKLVADAETDIGIAPGIKVTPRTEPANVFTKGQPMSIEFGLKRYSGTTPVGTGAPGDPPLSVTIEVKDKRNNVIFTEVKTLQGGLGEKGDMKLLPPTRTFTPQDDFFTACAKVNDIHAENGQNIKNNNDQLCQSFHVKDANRNYSVQELVVSPSGLVLNKNQSSINQAVDFNIPITNDSLPGSGNQLPANVNYVIYHNNTPIHQGTTSVAAGTTNTIAYRNNLALREGRHEFKVVLNPNRNPQESLQDGRDPYADNVKTFVLTVMKDNRACPRAESIVNHDKNRIVERQRGFAQATIRVPIMRYGVVDTYWDWWSERWVERKGYKFDRYETRTVTVPLKFDANGVPVRFGGNVYREIELEERMKLDTYYRSKYTMDKALCKREQRGEDSDCGWVNVRGADPQSLGIKAGTPFEIKTVMNYELKNIGRVDWPVPMPTFTPGTELLGPYGEYDYAGRYYQAQFVRWNAVTGTPPGPNPVNSPEKLFVRMPFKAEASSDPTTCFVLEKVKEENSGTKFKTEYRLPQRKAMSGNEMVRKVYVSRNARPANSGTFNVMLPPYPGYIAINPKPGIPRKPLSFKEPFSSNIMAYDDLKTQIIQ